ncbi:hypothetical protein KCTC32516_01822 [Polaribacter huanghezhanensis]|uniref:hypothetical protein n=1 Tax=Polaribacter huanghezhanensis TaxID=1354726 RepID=UPI0026495B88|nr:hypothetical protein [Polaribacter huanghezhanensis]WKD86447.1 hypothetical protein KCTC32516_01822 [Polaribacter huanghezhanensis]
MKKETQESSRIDLYVDHLLVCKDMDNLILKGHLMTERALQFYINEYAKKKVNFKKVRFTYSNKIEIAKLLGLFENGNSQLYRLLKLLNLLRNSIAHNVEYDTKTLDTFFKEAYIQKIRGKNGVEMMSTKHKFEYDLSKTEKTTINGIHFRLLLNVSMICSRIYKISGL